MPVDETEMRHALRNLASLAREFYDGLRDEGFQQGEALALTLTWMQTVVPKG